ncbi:MAG: hypothetical protein QOG38_1796 [Hyphomicrobiales bacterium]|jgi:hypothetical protein|nr:hypothetical protein [Hyphomicrobiales bacterium]
MPSLFRYFVVVGSVLLGLLWLVNYLVAPPTPAVAAVAPKTIVVHHDARASIIERWRNEQAARKAAERDGSAPVIVAAPQPAAAGMPEPVVAAAPEPVTPVSEPSPTKPEPPQIVAPVSLQTAAAAAPEVDAAEVRKAEQIKAAQARKARIARERARQKRQEKQHEEASRQQDQFFYGAQRRAYADAPLFPPFGSRPW